MATQQVSYYGVHWAPGKIAFLQQGRPNGANALGVKEPSPFFVRTARRWSCNHLISLNALNSAQQHLTAFEALVSRNNLARFMLPIPKEEGCGLGVLRSSRHDDELLNLTLLLKLSSPIKMPVFWANTSSVVTLMSELNMTNVQPLVLMGVEAQHTDLVRDLHRASLLAPRKLLVVAKDDVPIPSSLYLSGAHMMAQDEIDLAALPWETLGGMVLRAYMRQEWDGYWFTREPTPGDMVKGL